jgi:3-hydroxyacyl-[acyl-carrier-protein] dehydratase
MQKIKNGSSVNNQAAEGKAISFLVKDKIPHKGKMRLIDGIACKDGDRVRLSFIVPRDNIFLAADGVLASVALIEMLAQLCAAQYTFDQGMNASGLRGYLVGIDNVSFSGSIHAGDELTLVAWKTFEMTDIKRVNGEAFLGSERKASIELTLFESADWIAMEESVVKQSESAGAGNGLDDFYSREKDAVGKGIIASIASMVVKSDGAVEASLSFAPDFVGFSGHFPGYPVLPAILAIYSGWLLAEISRRQELELCYVKRAKFAAPIRPGDKVEIGLKKISSEDNQVEWYSLTINILGKLAAKYMIGTKPAVRKIK